MAVISRRFRDSSRTRRSMDSTLEVPRTNTHGNCKLSCTAHRRSRSGCGKEETSHKEGKEVPTAQSGSQEAGQEARRQEGTHWVRPPRAQAYSESSQNGRTVRRSSAGYILRLRPARRRGSELTRRQSRSCLFSAARICVAESALCCVIGAFGVGVNPSPFASRHGPSRRVQPCLNVHQAATDTVAERGLQRYACTFTCTCTDARSALEMLRGAYHGT
jgi:hypothetical protein